MTEPQSETCDKCGTKCDVTVQVSTTDRVSPKLCMGCWQKAIDTIRRPK